MGWFDGEDGEKLKNMMMFNFYGTDKELEEFTPVAVILVIIIFILFIGLGFWIFG